MKLYIRYILPLTFLLSLLLAPALRAEEFLQSGVPVDLTQTADTIVSYYKINVPSGSQELLVTIRGGTGDIDLLINKGSLILPGEWTTVVDSADAVSITDFADETIKLTTSSTPVLSAGVWYISTVSWNSDETAFSLTATLTGSSDNGSTDNNNNGSTGSGGMPAGVTINSEDGLTVIALGFTSDFEQSDIADITELVTGLLGSTAEQDTITVYLPETLIDMGYDGVQLHQWLLDQVSNFHNYIHVEVSKLQGKIHLEATQWNQSHPAGSYMVTLDVADPLPLESLFALLADGAKYVRVQTTDNGSSLQLNIYFQETLNESGAFLLGVDISTAMMEELMTQGMGFLNTSQASSGVQHPGAGGVPAGLSFITDGKLNVVALNISSQFDMDDVDSVYGLVSSLYSQLGAEDLIQLYSPAELISWGYDGSSLHSWLLGMTRDFASYTNINVSKGQDSNGGHYDLTARMWDANNPSGIEIGTLEIADPLPLNGLLALLNNGNSYIKITTSQPGGNSMKLALHVLANAQASPGYLGGVSITAAFLESLFSSLQ